MAFDELDRTTRYIRDAKARALEVLNEALERWLAEKGTLPERVSELVVEQFLPMLPMAPLGKVFMIDTENRRVFLVAEK